MITPSTYCSKKSRIAMVLVILISLLCVTYYDLVFSSSNQEASTSGQSYSATVLKAGSGFGIVLSSPPGIDCGNICSRNYNEGSSVYLVASPSPGSVLSSWSGDCGGVDTCILTMDSNKNVTAVFDLLPRSPALRGVGFFSQILILSDLIPKELPLNEDFNSDGFVNYLDLSILLFWFGKTGPEIVPYDLNGDKKVDFVDISILLYRWRQ